MKVVGGITILECEDVQKEIAGQCHEQCHFDKRLIHYTPRNAEGTERDYSLKVEAEVCCTMWHIVHRLPRDFWLRIANKTEQQRIDWFGSREAIVPTTGQRRKVKRASKPARIVMPDEKICLICGEPSDEDVCAKCL